MDVSKIKYVNGVTANIKDTVARQRIAQITGTFANKSHSHEYTEIVNAPWTNDDFANVAYELANTSLNVAMTVERDLFVHTLNNTVHMSQADRDALNNCSEKFVEYDTRIQGLADFTTNSINNCMTIVNNVSNKADSALELAEETVNYAQETINRASAAIDGKQDKLTAGAGITIDNNSVITATGAEPEWNNIHNKPATFPPSYHTQGISTITNLQSTLDGKQATINSSNKLDYAYLKNVPAAGVSDVKVNGTSVVTNGVAEIPISTNVQWNQIVQTGTKIAEVTIDGNTTNVFAPTSGDPPVTDVKLNGTSILNNSVAEINLATVATNGSYNDLKNKPTIPVVPSTWEWNAVANKPSAFTPSAHGHPISDVTNLQSTLDNKQNVINASNKLDYSLLSNAPNVEKFKVITRENSTYNSIKSDLASGYRLFLNMSGKMMTFAGETPNTADNYYFASLDTALTSPDIYVISIKCNKTAGWDTNLTYQELQRIVNSSNKIDYSFLTNVPTSFPPSSHNHDDRYFTETEVTTKLGTKQNTINSSNKLDYAFLSNVPSTFTPATHSHSISDVTNLQSTLNSKQNTINASNKLDYALLSNAPNVEDIKIITRDDSGYSSIQADLRSGKRLFLNMSGKMMAFAGETPNTSDAYYFASLDTALTNPDVYCISIKCSQASGWDTNLTYTELAKVSDLPKIFVATYGTTTPTILDWYIARDYFILLYREGQVYYFNYKNTTPWYVFSAPPDTTPKSLHVLCDKDGNWSTSTVRLQKEINASNKLDYAFLSNVPEIPSGSVEWSDVNNKPTFATVATNGSYNDLKNKPTIPTIPSTWEWANISNKPAFKTVATSGNYNDLTNKPTIPTIPSTWEWNNIANKPSSFTPSSHNHDDRYYTESEIDTKLNGKQNVINSSNKLAASNVSGLATVATNGSYNDLANKPTIPTIPSTWEWNAIANKPSTFTPSSHTHDDRYYTESETDTKLSTKQNLINASNKLDYSLISNAPNVEDIKVITTSDSTYTSIKADLQAGKRLFLNMSGKLMPFAGEAPNTGDVYYFASLDAALTNPDVYCIYIKCKQTSGWDSNLTYQQLSTPNDIPKVAEITYGTTTATQLDWYLARDYFIYAYYNGMYYYFSYKNTGGYYVLCGVPDTGDIQKFLVLNPQGVWSNTVNYPREQRGTTVSDYTYTIRLDAIPGSGDKIAFYVKSVSTSTSAHKLAIYSRTDSMSRIFTINRFGAAVNANQNQLSANTWYYGLIQGSYIHVSTEPWIDTLTITFNNERRASVIYNTNMYIPYKIPTTASGAGYAYYSPTDSTSTSCKFISPMYKSNGRFVHKEYTLTNSGLSSSVVTDIDVYTGGVS